ncbi:hypothetical protein [Georgenia wangjunii]|uniref:hypothetical protein n=1 Tax=Georgenia wangjunii TaxID=3117730 RepID=UPI002F262CFE
MRLKARHWGGVAVGAVALAVLGWLVGQHRVPVPLVLDRVPLRALLPGIAAILATYPLLDWFPGFSDLLVREARLRRWRVLAASLLYAMAVIPGITAGAAIGAAVGELNIALAFLALGLATIVLVGDLAWLAVLTATFTVLYLNVPPLEPLTRAAATPVALVVVAAAYLIAAGAYISCGPRRQP